VTGRFPFRRVLWAAGLLLSAATLLAPAPALASRPGGAPSKTQLTRLEHFEKYIEYFTSIRYIPGKTRVSPHYIRALVTAESSVNPRARSHKGARGLSQIMPETGRIAARELFESGTDFEFVDERRLARLDPEDLYDPAVNLLIASYLSTTYLERFMGRTDLVVAAWNAGPEAVARYGNRTPPYAETHQLLARVRGYLTYFERGSVPSWQTAAWEIPPMTTGRGWHLVPALPSRDYVVAARRAAQRVSVPNTRMALGAEPETVVD
jgi:soluble lytic murein transglycosylase-like protein